MNLGLFYVMYLMIFLPITIIMASIPYLTRKTESFGVTIPYSVYKNEHLVKMRKSYAWTVVIVAIIVSVIAFTMGSLQIISLFMPLFLVLSFVIYVIYHRRMKQYKATQKWEGENRQTVTIDTTFRENKLTYSNAWFTLPFLVIIGMLIVSIAMYNKLPDKIPTHYDFSGHATTWAKKSYGSLLMIPATELYMLVLFMGINVMIAKSKQLIEGSSPQESVQKNIQFRRRWSAYNIALNYAIVLIFTLVQLSLLFHGVNVTVIPFIILFIVVIIMASTIWLSFKTGQGGSRIDMNHQIILGSSAKKVDAEIDRDDDHFWKLGVIYFNPKDPAIFVEKRFGVGWTFNTGQPLGWVALLIVIAIPLLIKFI